jgi:meiotically up-regulated gene 157 (Mug157) protein
LRIVGTLLCALLLTVAWSAGARSQNLMAVPLTGERVHSADPQTLFHTLFSDFADADDGTTYVETGDIPAMWLRDSSAQTIPYLRFERYFPSLRSRFEGVIERNARNIQTDPYANAFQEHYHIWERKWEVDSLSWPVVLAFVDWNENHDRTIFTPTLHKALATIVATYSCEQRHASCSSYTYPYHVITHEEFNPNTGMIWCAFRPSDDAVSYRFNIPQNQFAVVALRALAQLATDGYGDTALAARAQTLANQVFLGIEHYGRIYEASRGGYMYVYETDGNGQYKLMDDANIPNLTTMPYFGWSSPYDPTYLRTRAFTLSSGNPYFFKGTYAEGLGSPHTPFRFVWPLGIIGRALTSTSASEISESITVLAQTDSEGGLIHESFYADGYWRFTREDFGWANALYAQLLFRSIAGFAGTPFVADGYAMLPFERVGDAPVLPNTLAQIQNQGAIYEALARLLAAADK